MTSKMSSTHRPLPGSTSGQWLILCVALLTLGGAAALALYVEHGRVEEREQNRLMTQARVIQDNIEQNLNATSQVLVDLRNALARRHWRQRELNDYLSTLTNAMPGVRTLLVLAGDGKVAAASRPELLGLDLAHRDYFQTARQNHGADTLFVSAPFQTALGIYGVNVARTLAGPNSEFSGIVVATLDPEYFRTLLASVIYANDMRSALAHGDGILFLTVPKRDRGVGMNLAQPGSFFTRHRDSGKTNSVMVGTAHATGDERMMALRTIQPPQLKLDKPLVVAVSRDLHGIFEAWRRDVRTQGGLFLAIALLAIGSLKVLQRRQRELERQAAAAATLLHDNERFMRMVTDNIPGMVAYWDRELRCGFANKAHLEWFGKTPEQMQGIRIQDLLGEELFCRHESSIQAALRGERQQFEGSLVKADGSTGHTWTHYIPDFDGKRVKGFFVLVSDVTALKQAEIAVAESEWTLRTIIENEPECVKVLAPDGTVKQINRAGLDMIEADSEDQVLGHEFSGLVAPGHREAFVALNERVNRGEPGTLEFEIAGLKGGHRWLDTHAVPMRNAGGRITGLLGVTRDITQHKAAEQALQRLAQTDSLTGLANRRHFLARAGQELSRTVRHGGPLSVFMIDIDRFKNINDTFGHKAGDVVLRTLGKIARDALRDIDVVGRIGGEEFAVVLPQTDHDRAQEVAERLRAKIAAAAPAGPDGTLRFTVSIGVTTLIDAGTSIDTLLAEADAALYRAKKGGRNRVCVCPREPQGGPA